MGAVESNKFIYSEFVCVCVCVALGIQNPICIRHILICGLSGRSIFIQIISNGTIFGGKSYWA